MSSETSRVLRLTKSSIDKLAFSEKRYEVTDDKLAGFKLRVGPRKKVFYLRYWFGRHRRTFKIGEYGPWTPEQARERAKQLLREIDSGKDPATERAISRSAPTFAEVAREYLTHAQKRSLEDDKSKLRRVLLPLWGARQVTAISVKDVRNVMKMLADRDLTPATCNRYLALVKVIFGRAIEWGYVSESPAQREKPLTENNHRERFLSPVEIGALLWALQEAPPNAGNAIKFMLFTGQRAGNVMGARWEEFTESPHEVLWTIPRTKSGKRHHVYLSSEAIAVLSEQRGNGRAGSEYVFPGRHGKPHLTSVQAAWKRACSSAGLAGVRLHDLRHTYASNAIAQGATLFDVQDLLGHSGPQVTQRYAHLAEDRRKRLAGIATKGMVLSLEEYKSKKAAS